MLAAQHASSSLSVENGIHKHALHCLFSFLCTHTWAKRSLCGYTVPTWVLFVVTFNVFSTHLGKFFSQKRHFVKIKWQVQSACARCRLRERGKNSQYDITVMMHAQMSSKYVCSQFYQIEVKTNLTAVYSVSPAALEQTKMWMWVRHKRWGRSVSTIMCSMVINITVNIWEFNWNT